MKKKKYNDMTPRQLRCPHCGAVAGIRSAAEIYNDPKRTDEMYCVETTLRATPMLGCTGAQESR